MTARLVTCLAAALALAGCGIQEAREGLSKRDDVLDKVAVEDMLTRFYQDSEGRDPAEFTEFYTEDAVLDVNGNVARGIGEIAAFHESSTDSSQARGARPFHRVLSNVVVDVEGDTATASMLWTGFDNRDLRGPPTIREQGREYDLLVRNGAGWLIKKRVVVADSGLPESMAANYDARRNYDITAE